MASKQALAACMLACLACSVLAARQDSGYDKDGEAVGIRTGVVGFCGAAVRQHC
jgi:hypothetical protein